MNNQIFEAAYINVRNKESRILSDDTLRQLPYITEGKYKNEWMIRAKSANRFITYLNQLSTTRNVLEIGCGNGWFSHMIAQQTNCKVWGTDINLTELEQAKRVFKNNSIQFSVFNLSDDTWTEEAPDIIVFNASIQYFNNLSNTITQLKKIIKTVAEVHFIDSPFYTKENLIKAKEKTKQYYTELKSENMIPFYHHHSLDELRELHAEFLFKPYTFPVNRVIKDSPFPWVKILITPF